MDLGCRQPEKKGKGRAVLHYIFGQAHSCGIFPPGLMQLMLSSPHKEGFWRPLAMIQKKMEILP